MAELTKEERDQQLKELQKKKEEERLAKELRGPEDRYAPWGSVALPEVLKSYKPTPLVAEEAPATEEPAKDIDKLVEETEDEDIDTDEDRLNQLKGKRSKLYKGLQSTIKQMPDVPVRQLEKSEYTGDKVFDLAQQNRFDEALREAKRQYKQDQERIDKRAAIINIFHNLSQLAAAIYGQKHNVDMTNLKFDKPDFDKEKALSRADYAQAMQEVADRRRDVISRAREAQEKDIQAKKLGVSLTEQEVQEESRLIAAKQKATIDAVKRAAKESEENKRKVAKAMNLYASAEAMDDEKEKAKLVASADKLLVEVLPVETYEKLTQGEEQGFFGALFGAKPTKVKLAPGKIKENLSDFARGYVQAAPESQESTTAKSADTANTFERLDPASGRIVIFDSTTKKALRFK